MLALLIYQSLAHLVGVDFMEVDLMGGHLNNVTVYSITAYTKTRRTT